MILPQHLIRLAQRKANITKMRIDIYKYNDTYIIAPFGYIAHPDAVLLVYVTVDGRVHENTHDTKTRSVDGN